jgi:UDP-glucose 4-epimerase
MLDNFRIVVTGSSGFVGSRLLQRLRKLGASLITIDIKNGTDITDWKQIRKIDNFFLLFHLAARTFVPDSFKSPRDFYQTNILGTINALELCRINKAKMVFTSSYVYGNPNYLPVDEKHPVVPFNPYANTKIISEQICKNYNRNFNLPIIILRPFNIYGPGQSKKFLIPSIIKQAIDKKVLLKDPSPKRDMLFVDDLIEAYIKTMNYDKNTYDIFNIGSGKSYSVKEICHTIIKNINPNIEVTFEGKRRRDEIDNAVADISKAKKLLNWSPKISLEEGIKQCILWYKSERV